MMEGVVNVLKAPGLTSSDVVSDIRKIFGQKRVGHTGTLDPDAAGVLPICVGRATRLFDYLVDKNKVYIGEIKYEYGVIWGKLIANGTTGWVNLSGVTYTVAGTTTAEMNVRTAKYTGTEDNILGSIPNGTNISVCELSFDENGNLWGKLTGWGGDPAMNGGYLVIKNSAGDVRVSGVIG